MVTDKSLIIGIVGSGAMGSGIAQVAATAGHKVFVYDNKQAALDKAKNGLKSTLSKLVEKQKLTAEKSEAVFSSIHFVSDKASFKNCSLIIEAIVENPTTVDEPLPPDPARSPPKSAATSRPSK